MIFKRNEILIVAGISDPTKYFVLREFGNQPWFRIQNNQIITNFILTHEEIQFIKLNLL